ncbi:MFS superfamily sulfate permease-like transporter [Actinomadura catellatispora]|uniref:MFS superfamily sulfate permease-like transporter n=1 Tax=Actinomadura livida TaxID=79909 RepID=A0A7W7I954_9ACTN|nr:MFS superfamily sulfate permease-like transporter [Actinomadura catellatispora]
MLAGLVVALALIPEAISFSIIAGVDPSVGLFASFTMAVTIAVVGGRPAMISAATGAIALVVAPLAREHGLGHLIAAVILGGLLQIILGGLGVARLMRFVPRSVMVGFVNALAILIFMAQVPELRDVPWPVYPLVVGGLVLMVLFPRVSKAVPAPLVSIVILTALTIGAGIAVPTVGDKGALPSSLPTPGPPDVPFTFDTLALLAPYAHAAPAPGPRRATGRPDRSGPHAGAEHGAAPHRRHTRHLVGRAGAAHARHPADDAQDRHRARPP